MRVWDVKMCTSFSQRYDTRYYSSNKQSRTIALNIMKDAKKDKTNATRKVTRKSNELLTAIKGEVHMNEIREKIDSLKEYK